MATTRRLCGRFRLGVVMSRLRSFSDAPNATTHSENTVKHSAFRGNILTVALKLRELGLSESYLTTMIRALNDLGRSADLGNHGEVSLCIAKKKVRDSYKANLCDFYKHC